MSFYNQYYTRGYAVRYENDEYKEPLAQNAGYSTVGVSKNLDRYYVENIETLCSKMGFPILNEDVKSLYLVRNALSSKCVLGQCCNSKNGNFLDHRSNHFVHNVIMEHTDFRDIIYDPNNHKYLFSAQFKDTYVGKSSPNSNELSYTNAITPSYSRIADILPDCDSSLNIAERLERHEYVTDYCMSKKAAYSIVYHMLKTSEQIVIEVSQDIEQVDRIARRILSMLYRWMPLKCLERMGFMSCLNINDPPKDCRLLFCSSEISRRIKMSGLKSVSPNELVFISCIDDSNVARVNESALSENESEFVNIIAKCVAGEVTDPDVNAIMELRDIEISHRSLTYSIEYLARLFNIIYKKQEAAYDIEAAKSVFRSTFYLHRDCDIQIPESISILQKHDFFSGPIISKGYDKDFILDMSRTSSNAVASFYNVTNKDIQSYIDRDCLNLPSIASRNDYENLEKCRQYINRAYDIYCNNEYDMQKEYNCGIIIIFKAYKAHNNNSEMRDLMGNLITAIVKSVGKPVVYGMLDNRFIDLMLFKLLQNKSLIESDCNSVIVSLGTDIFKLIKELGATSKDYLQGKTHISKYDFKVILKCFFMYLLAINKQDYTYLRYIKEFYVKIVKANSPNLDEFNYDIQHAINTNLVQNVCAYPKNIDKLDQSLTCWYAIKDLCDYGDYDKFISKIIAILACMNYKFKITPEFNSVVNNMFKNQRDVIENVINEGYIYNLIKNECSISPRFTNGHAFNNILPRMKCTNFVNTLAPYFCRNKDYENWRQTCSIKPYPSYISTKLSENIATAFEQCEDRASEINKLVEEFNKQADFTRLYVIPNDFAQIIGVLKKYSNNALYSRFEAIIDNKIQAFIDITNDSKSQWNKYFVCMFNIWYFNLDTKNAISFMNNQIDVEKYSYDYSTVRMILETCDGIYTNQSIDTLSRSDFIYVAAFYFQNMDAKLCEHLNLDDKQIRVLLNYKTASILLPSLIDKFKNYQSQKNKGSLKKCVLITLIMILISLTLVILLNYDDGDIVSPSDVTSKSDIVSTTDKQITIKIVSGTDFVDISKCVDIKINNDNSIYMDVSFLESYLGLHSDLELLNKKLELTIYDDENACKENSKNYLMCYSGAGKLDEKYKFVTDDEHFKFEAYKTYYFKIAIKTSDKIKKE